MCMIMDSLAGSGDIVFVCKRRKKTEKIKKKKKKSVLTFDHFPRGGRGRGGAGQAAFEEPETAVSHRITETHAVLLLSREAADVFFFFFFPQTSGGKKESVQRWPNGSLDSLESGVLNESLTPVCFPPANKEKG